MPLQNSPSASVVLLPQQSLVEMVVLRPTKGPRPLTLGHTDTDSFHACHQLDRVSKTQTVSWK